MKSVVEFYTHKYGDREKEFYSLMEMLRFAEQYMKEAVLVPLITVVAKEFNITEEVMFSRSRKAEHVNARQMYVLLLSKNMKVKPAIIADHIGFDRVTIMHSIKAISNLIETDKKISMIYNRLYMQIISGRVLIPEQLLPLSHQENISNHAGKTKVDNNAMASEGSGPEDDQDNPQGQGSVLSYGKVEKREPSLQGSESAVCGM